MNPEILNPKEENLFSLATEMGLIVFSPEEGVNKRKDSAPIKIEPHVSKPYSQLT